MFSTNFHSLKQILGQSPVKCKHFYKKRSTKAAVYVEHGKPLEIKEIKQEKLSNKQVRIKVHYSCLDCETLNVDKKLPFTPGYELSGEVIEVGSNVNPTNATVGGKVAALCLEKYSTLANECIVDAVDVFPIPGNVELSKAAALIYAYPTALYAFSQLCKPSPKNGALLLVSCNAAGLGIAALDISASIYKAKVIGVSDTEERAELLRSRGAFASINLNEKKLRERILQRTKNREIDIAYYDGGANLKDMMFCVKLGGTLISTGVTKEISTSPVNKFLTIVDLYKLRSKNSELYRQVILDTLELADQGVLSPHINATYELKLINDAIRFINDKKSTGKVLIKML